MWTANRKKEVPLSEKERFVPRRNVVEEIRLFVLAVHEYRRRLGMLIVRKRVIMLVYRYQFTPMQCWLMEHMNTQCNYSEWHYVKHLHYPPPQCYFILVFVFGGNRAECVDQSSDNTHTCLFTEIMPQAHCDFLYADL